MLVNSAFVYGLLLLPLWGAGAVALLAARRLRAYRVLGVAFWVLLALMMASHTSRSDRIVGLSVALYASGAVVWEGWLRSKMARIALVGAVVLSGLAFAPVSLPLLPFERTAAYAAKLGLVPRIERGKTSSLPQWLADRTGWESFLSQMERAVASLSPDERAHALIYTDDYGHAGALELWGPARGFPPVICPHNTYYHWSAGHSDSQVLIAVGKDMGWLPRLFADVRTFETVTCPYCMSWRNGRAIKIARRPTVPLSRVWERFKHYE